MKLNSSLLKSIALTLVLTFSVTSTIAYGDSSVIVQSLKNNFATVGVHPVINEPGAIAGLTPSIARGTVKFKTHPRAELRSQKIERPRFSDEDQVRRDLIQYIYEHGQIEWDAESFGHGKAKLEYNFTNTPIIERRQDKIVVNVELNWAKNYEKLEPLYGDKFYTDRGGDPSANTFGFILLEFPKPPDDKPYRPEVIIRVIQTSARYHRLNNHQRAHLDRWRAAALASILSWAKSRGVDVFAQTPELVNEQKKQHTRIGISEEELKHNYVEPFQNPNWRVEYIPSMSRLNRQYSHYDLFPDSFSAGVQKPWYVYTGINAVSRSELREDEAVPVSTEKTSRKAQFLKEYLRPSLLFQAPIGFFIWIFALRPFDLFFHELGHVVSNWLFYGKHLESVSISLPFFKLLKDFIVHPGWDTFWRLKGYRGEFNHVLTPGYMPSDLAVLTEFLAGPIFDAGLITALLSVSYHFLKRTAVRYRLWQRFAGFLAFGWAATIARRTVLYSMHAPADLFIVEKISGVHPGWFLAMLLSAPLVFLLSKKILSWPGGLRATGILLISGSFIFAYPFYTTIYLPWNFALYATAVAGVVGSIGLYFLFSNGKHSSRLTKIPGMVRVPALLALFLNTVGLGYARSEKDMFLDIAKPNLKGEAPGAQKAKQKLLQEWYQQLMIDFMFDPSTLKSRLLKLTERHSRLAPKPAHLLHMFSQNYPDEIRELVRALTDEEFVRLGLHEDDYYRLFRRGVSLGDLIGEVIHEMGKKGVSFAAREIVYDLLPKFKNGMIPLELDSFLFWLQAMIRDLPSFSQQNAYAARLSRAEMAGVNPDAYRQLIDAIGRLMRRDKDPGMQALWKETEEKLRKKQASDQSASRSEKRSELRSHEPAIQKLVDRIAQQLSRPVEIDGTAQKILGLSGSESVNDIERMLAGDPDLDHIFGHQWVPDPEFSYQVVDLLELLNLTEAEKHSLILKRLEEKYLKAPVKLPDHMTSAGEAHPAIQITIPHESIWRFVEQLKVVGRLDYQLRHAVDRHIKDPNFQRKVKSILRDIDWHDQTFEAKRTFMRAFLTSRTPEGAQSERYFKALLYLKDFLNEIKMVQHEESITMLLEKSRDTFFRELAEAVSESEHPPEHEFHSMDRAVAMNQPLSKQGLHNKENVAARIESINYILAGFLPREMFSRLHALEELEGKEIRIPAGARPFTLEFSQNPLTLREEQYIDEHKRPYTDPDGGVHALEFRDLKPQDFVFFLKNKDSGTRVRGAYLRLSVDQDGSVMLDFFDLTFLRTPGEKARDFLGIVLSNIREALEQLSEPTKIKGETEGIDTVFAIAEFTLAYFEPELRRPDGKSQELLVELNRQVEEHKDLKGRFVNFRERRTRLARVIQPLAKVLEYASQKFPPFTEAVSDVLPDTLWADTRHTAGLVRPAWKIVKHNENDYGIELSAEILPRRSELRAEPAESTHVLKLHSGNLAQFEEQLIRLGNELADQKKIEMFRFDPDHVDLRTVLKQDEPTSLSHVYVSNGEVLGVLLASFDVKNEKLVTNIHYLGVKPGRQGAGIGIALIRQMAAVLFRELDITKVNSDHRIVWSVDSDNTDAVRFYEKLEATKVDEKERPTDRKMVYGYQIRLLDLMDRIERSELRVSITDPAYSIIGVAAVYRWLFKSHLKDVRYDLSRFYSSNEKLMKEGASAVSSGDSLVQATRDFMNELAESRPYDSSRPSPEAFVGPVLAAISRKSEQIEFALEKINLPKFQQEAVVLFNDTENLKWYKPADGFRLISISLQFLKLKRKLEFALKKLDQYLPDDTDAQFPLRSELRNNDRDEVAVQKQFYILKTSFDPQELRTAIVELDRLTHHDLAIAREINDILAKRAFKADFYGEKLYTQLLTHLKELGFSSTSKQKLLKLIIALIGGYGLYAVIVFLSLGAWPLWYRWSAFAAGFIVPLAGGLYLAINSSELLSTRRLHAQWQVLLIDHIQIFVERVFRQDLVFEKYWIDKKDQAHEKVFLSEKKYLEAHFNMSAFSALSLIAAAPLYLAVDPFIFFFYLGFLGLGLGVTEMQHRTSKSAALDDLTAAVHSKTANEPSQSNKKLRSELREDSDLSIQEIDERMKKDGFPELELLWNKFKRLKISLNEINEAKLERARIEHTRAALIGNPWLHLLAVGLIGVMGYFYASIQRMAVGILFSAILLGMDGNLKNLDIKEMIKTSEPAGWMESVFVAAGFSALFYILAVFAKRMFIFSWKTISALDLASMLKRQSYRQWFDQTPEAIQTMERLKAMGINNNWDNPNYKIYYQIRGDNVEPAPAEKFEYADNQTIEQFIQAVLIKFLGTREEREIKDEATRIKLGKSTTLIYVPGQFTPNLKQQQKSAMEFVRNHQAELSRSKAGELPVEDGKKLLQELLDQYVKTDAAKASQYLRKSIEQLDDWGNLPDGIVEARIWRRDPWFDLTNQKDFFSSASLRGNTWLDKLNRRTKGALGPFNYLHNKSISAIDFRTREGRRVRARIAAAIYKDKEGKDQPILFVDGAEGRIFDAKAKGIQKTIEDYARASGFKSVLYFAYPLNQGPKRLVEYVKKSNQQLELMSIEYADSSQKQYLDVYGYPVEPLEYAFPKGEVIGHVTDLTPQPNRPQIFPSKATIAWFKFRKQYFLKSIAASLVLVVAGPAAWFTDNASLIPPLLLFFGSMWWFQHKSERRAITKESKADAKRSELRSAPRMSATSASTWRSKSELRSYPKFIETILAEINENPVAQKMSYSNRAIGKLSKLLEYFQNPDRSLRYFFEEILYNVSVKDGDLENALKFLDKLPPDQRLKVQEVIAVVWAKANSSVMNGLSEDKAARENLKKVLFERILVVQKFMKATRLSRMKISDIGKMQKALKMDIQDVLDIVTISPRILKGLRKPPRPIYAWPAPTIAAFLVGFGAFSIFPLISNLILFLILMGIIAPGTYLISTRLNIAPGILYYKNLRNYLSKRLHETEKVSAIENKMEQLGINLGEFKKGRVYENKEKGIRIRIHDKRTLKGAVDFLTSSEAIGNCISLQHFVAWMLPSLLNDDGIILADIDHKGSGDAYQHRAQMWMIAAEENREPVLTVNSFEFNNDGAKYFDEIMPEAITVLQEFARRTGFKKIYAGITNYGRDYLDRHFSQGNTQGTIKKIHDREAGYQYHFDALRYRWFARDFIFKKSRGAMERAYAVIFGMLELAKGNGAKAKAFFDSARNARNFWEIPLNNSDKSFRSELRSEAPGAFEIRVAVKNAQGVHARPVSYISQIGEYAQSQGVVIKVRRADKEPIEWNDADSPMQLMLLEGYQGTHLIFNFEFKDPEGKILAERLAIAFHEMIEKKLFWEDVGESSNPFKLIQDVLQIPEDQLSAKVSELINPSSAKSELRLRRAVLSAVSPEALGGFQNGPGSNELLNGGVSDNGRLSKRSRLSTGSYMKMLATLSLSYTPSFALAGQMSQALINNTPKRIEIASREVIAVRLMNSVLMTAIAMNFTMSVSILAINSLLESENRSRMLWNLSAWGISGGAALIPYKLLKVNKNIYKNELRNREQARRSELRSEDSSLPPWVSKERAVTGNYIRWESVSGKKSLPGTQMPRSKVRADDVKLDSIDSSQFRSELRADIDGNIQDLNISHVNTKKVILQRVRDMVPADRVGATIIEINSYVDTLKHQYSDFQLYELAQEWVSAPAKRTFLNGFAYDSLWKFVKIAERFFSNRANQDSAFYHPNPRLALIEILTEAYLNELIGFDRETRTALIVYDGNRKRSELRSAIVYGVVIAALASIVPIAVFLYKSSKARKKAAKEREQRINNLIARIHTLHNKYFGYISDARAGRALFLPEVNEYYASIMPQLTHVQKTLNEMKKNPDAFEDEQSWMAQIGPVVDKYEAMIDEWKKLSTFDERPRVPSPAPRAVSQNSLTTTVRVFPHSSSRRQHFKIQSTFPFRAARSELRTKRAGSKLSQSHTHVVSHASRAHFNVSAVASAEPATLRLVRGRGPAKRVSGARQPKIRLKDNRFERASGKDSARRFHLFDLLSGQAISQLEEITDEVGKQILLDGFLKATLHVIKLFDPVTYGHTVRVTRLTMVLAKALQSSNSQIYGGRIFSPRELRQLYFAAMFHDVGKIGVRQEIIQKMNKLYPHEYESLMSRLESIRYHIQIRSLERQLMLVMPLGLYAVADFIQSEWDAAEKALHEVDHIRELIDTANRPNVLAETVSGELRGLNDRRWRDEHGVEHPILTEHEIESLSIPRGSLTPAERNEIESHVAKSLEILQLIPWPADFREIVKIAGDHHETLNGAGYPNHLKGDQILLESRIMTIADIYDALTAKDRPYKKALPHEKAIEILQDEANRGRIDAELLQIFVDSDAFKAVDNFSPNEEINDIPHVASNEADSRSELRQAVPEKPKRITKATYKSLWRKILNEIDNFDDLFTLLLYTLNKFNRRSDEDYARFVRSWFINHKAGQLQSLKEKLSKIFPNFYSDLVTIRRQLSDDDIMEMAGKRGVKIWNPKAVYSVETSVSVWFERDKWFARTFNPQAIQFDYERLNDPTRIVAEDNPYENTESKSRQMLRLPKIRFSSLFGIKTEDDSHDQFIFPKLDIEEVMPSVLETLGIKLPKLTKNQIAALFDDSVLVYWRAKNGEQHPIFLILYTDAADRDFIFWAGHIDEAVINEAKELGFQNFDDIYDYFFKLAHLDQPDLAKIPAILLGELTDYSLSAQDQGGEFDFTLTLTNDSSAIRQLEESIKQELTQIKPRSELRREENILLKNLSHPNAVIRKTAADRIGQDDSVAFEDLLDYLQSPDIPENEWSSLIDKGQRFNPSIARQFARYSALYVLNWWIERDPGFYIPVFKTILDQEKSIWNDVREAELDYLYSQNSKNPLGIDQELSLLQIIKLFRQWYSEIKEKSRALQLSEKERQIFSTSKYVHRVVKILEEVMESNQPVIDEVFYRRSDLVSLSQEHAAFKLVAEARSKLRPEIHISGTPFRTRRSELRKLGSLPLRRTADRNKKTAQPIARPSGFKIPYSSRSSDEEGIKNLTLEQTYVNHENGRLPLTKGMPTYRETALPGLEPRSPSSSKKDSIQFELQGRSQREHGSIGINKSKEKYDINIKLYEIKRELLPEDMREIKDAEFEESIKSSVSEKARDLVDLEEGKAVQAEVFGLPLVLTRVASENPDEIVIDLRLLAKSLKPAVHGKVVSSDLLKYFSELSPAAIPENSQKRLAAIISQVAALQPAVSGPELKRIIEKTLGIDSGVLTNGSAGYVITGDLFNEPGTLDILGPALIAVVKATNQPVIAFNYDGYGAGVIQMINEELPKHLRIRIANSEKQVRSELRKAGVTSPFVITSKSNQGGLREKILRQIGDVRFVNGVAGLYEALNIEKSIVDAYRSELRVMYAA